MPHRVRGFSLVEVLIAVALVAVLGTILVPAVTGIVFRRAVRDARDTFVAKHGLARSVAIREGRLAELHIDDVNGRIWIEVDTSVARTGLMDTVGLIAHLSDQAVSMSSDRALVCFDGRGLASQAAACESPDILAVFTRGGQVDTVRVSAAGTLLP